MSVGGGRIDRHRALISIGVDIVDKRRDIVGAADFEKKYPNMNDKAKKYLEICAAEDEGTSEGVRKAWETRRRGGSVAGRWNDYSVYARPNAPAWDSDHFKAAREAYQAHSDYVDQLNAAHPGPMGGQMWTSEELAKKNELAKKARETWFNATEGWKPRERVSFIQENNLERM